MIRIRHGLFETNSSSVHAIVINDEIGNYEGAEVELSIGEYGWEHDVLSTPKERAAYFYTAACALNGRDMYSDINELLAPYGVIIKPDHFNYPRFRNYDDHYYLDNGFIDHVDGCSEWVNDCFKSPELLLCFIFSDKSYVVTGNDNDGFQDEEKIDNENGTVYWKGN